MVHLSVAIARFAETLFWGIAQAAGLALVGGLRRAITILVVIGYGPLTRQPA